MPCMPRGSDSNDAERLAAWSLVHALAMLAATLAGGVLGRTWPLGAACRSTFGVRRRWCARRGRDSALEVGSMGVRPRRQRVVGGARPGAPSGGRGRRRRNAGGHDFLCPLALLVVFPALRSRDMNAYSERRYLA